MDQQQNPAKKPSETGLASQHNETLLFNAKRSRQNRNVTFAVLGVLLLVVVGLMTWQSLVRSQKDGRLDAGWWIGSFSTLVLGALALFLGYRASEPSWSDSVSQSLEKLVAFTERLSSGVDRIDSASDRVRKAIQKTSD